MGKAILVVLTNAADGRHEEFNDWYDNIHLDEIVALECMEGAQRYQAAGTQDGSEPPFRYLAIYETNTDDPEEVFGALGKAAADGMDMSGPLDMQNIAVWLFTEHGARKVAPPS
jgi:hypothetical protein